jgi:hypothetical protein
MHETRGWFRQNAFRKRSVAALHLGGWVRSGQIPRRWDLFFWEDRQ